MKKTQIVAPEWANTESMRTWQATYKVLSVDNVRIITIDSRSAIDVVVARICSHNTILGSYTRYYLSSPNYGIAIPWISSLADAHWINERLIEAGMPSPDAITVAQVLQESCDF
jgi:hypothetical protein